MSSFWQKLRKDFPITGRTIYLDHASAGPVSRPAAESYAAYARTHLERADYSWPEWIHKREEVRALAARLINAHPDEIAFTSSTSHGMNMVAELLAGRGSVLTNDAEFPTTTVPWLWRKSKLLFQPQENYAVSTVTLKEKLKPGVRTILTSWVQYATGYRQDLEALGKLKKNRFLVVNATQGLGALQADVEKWQADFLCTNSYKWMMGGYGCGLLYVRRKWLERLKPQGAGWRSVREPDRMDNRATNLRADAGRYEWGCPPFPVIFAMGAAMDYVMQIGLARIEKRILELTAFTRESLSKAGFEIISPAEALSGITVFRVKQAPLLFKKLLSQGVYVSARGEGIRIAPHFYNTFEEIETAVSKIKKLTGARS